MGYEKLEASLIDMADTQGSTSAVLGLAILNGYWPKFSSVQG